MAAQIGLEGAESEKFRSCLRRRHASPQLIWSLSSVARGFKQLKTFNCYIRFINLRVRFSLSVDRVA
jgi:hypothetical protein